MEFEFEFDFVAGGAYFAGKCGTHALKWTALARARGTFRARNTYTVPTLTAMASGYVTLLADAVRERAAASFPLHALGLRFQAHANGPRFLVGDRAFPGRLRDIPRG